MKFFIIVIISLFCINNTFAQDSTKIIHITQSTFDTMGTDYKGFEAIGNEFIPRTGIVFYADTDSMPQFIFFIAATKPKGMSLDSLIHKTLNQVPPVECSDLFFQLIFRKSVQNSYKKMQSLPFTTGIVLNTMWILPPFKVKFIYGTILFNRNKNEKLDVSSVKSRVKREASVEYNKKKYTINLLHLKYKLYEQGLFWEFRLPEDE